MNTENENKWFDTVRRKLENYEEPTGEQLWERIAQDLPAKRPRKAVVVRIAAIASTCAALFAGIFLLTSRPDATQKQAARPSLVSTNDGNKKPATATAAPNILTASSLIDSPSAIAETRSNPNPQASSPALPDATNSYQTARDAEAETAQPSASTADTTEIAQTPPPADTLRLLEHRFDNNRNASRPAIAKKLPKRKSDHKKWHIAIAATNQFGGNGSSSTQGFSPLLTTDFGVHKPATVGSSQPDAQSEVFRETYYKVLAHTIDKPTSTDDIYSLPVSYSASFRYMLTEHWGLNIGISYANASTERRSGSESDYYSIKQKTHYVGIPLSVSYTFLDTRYLTLYALAGGSIEKCVAATQENAIVAAGNELEKTTFKDEKTSSKPWQGTLSIGAGVQFNITSHYGLFAEPLLAYDLGGNNGSLPLRRRNDLNFQLSIGLRVSY